MFTEKAKRRSDCWNEVVENYYPTLDRSRIPAKLGREIGGLVAEFLAHTDYRRGEIERRRKKLAAEYGTKADTARALAKHWDRYPPNQSDNKRYRVREDVTKRWQKAIQDRDEALSRHWAGKGPYPAELVEACEKLREEASRA